MIPDAESAELWVRAGLALAPEVGDANRWIAAACGELAVLPPPAVVLEVASLLDGRPPDPPQRLPGALGEAVERYYEHLLGRLAAAGSLLELREALRSRPVEERPAAVAVFLSLLLERIGYDAPSAPPALLRRLTQRGLDEDLGFLALEDPEVQAALAAGYEALAEGARKVGRLFGRPEVFVIEHLDALRGAARRLALTQLAEAAEAFGRAMPRRIRSRRKSEGAAPTRVQDESAYPIGGYASISTSGPLENLLSSELIYMDSKPGIDAFAVRWASGELLKYTRDESVFLRPRRVICFSIEAELAAHRVKDPGARWQRPILVLGMLAAAVRCLCRWLDEVELELWLVFEEVPDTPLAGDLDLMRLLLSDEVERGVVRLSESTPEALEATLEAEQAVAWVDRVDVAGELTGPAEWSEWTARCQALLESLV